MTDFEIAMSLVACVGSGGAGCLVVGLELAALNSFVAVASGAGFGQTLLNTSIGLGVGLATGGLGQELGLNAWEGLLLGSASAAVTTGVANVISGQEFFQYNVLGSAILTAAQGAATMGLTKVVGVSQASAGTAQGGGGSSDPRYMHRTAWFRDTATGTMQAIDPEGSMENFIKTGESPLLESDDGGDWHRLTHTFKEVVRSMEKIGVDLDAIRVNDSTGAAGQGGITFWNHVFLHEGMSNTDQAYMLTHEMVHAPQWSSLAPVVFLVRYGIEQPFLPNRGYGDPAALAGVPVGSTSPVGRDYSLDGAADHVQCQFFPGGAGCH